MNIKSKQTIFAILAGMIVGLLVPAFIQPTCWGPLIGVWVAAYLAKVASAKEGALIGAIVLVPIGIYNFLQIPSEAITGTTVDKLGNLVGLTLGLLLTPGVGILYGAMIGKLLESTKYKRIIV